MTLVGPPQAVSLKTSEEGTGSELDGRSLVMVLITEFLARVVIFSLSIIIIRVGIGDVAYHKYNLTSFIIIWISAAFAHTTAYYLTIGISDVWGSFERASKFYRFLRNICLSTMPAVVVALFTLVWRDLNHVALFRDGFVWQLLVYVWLVFMLVGILESLLVKRIPFGLNSDASALASKRVSIR